MRDHKISLEVFKECLNALNSKLVAMNESIEIKAIGGFALLYYGFRKVAYTHDIDTLNLTYPSHVMEAVEEVAVEFDISSYWLNNDVARSAEDLEDSEAMLNAFWEKVDWEFSNISLYVADPETLLLSKLMAAEEDDLTRRFQDFIDLMDMFEHLGCKSLGDCHGHCMKMDIVLSKEYPRNYERLAAEFAKVR